MIAALVPCKNHPLVEEPLVRCARCGEAFCPNCVVDIGGSPYCATCKGEILGDMRAGRPAAGPDLASIGRRFGAIFLDGMILGLPLMVIIVVVLGSLGVFSASFQRQQLEPATVLVFEGLFILAAGACSILYEGFMLARDGQTLGKKAMRVRVVSAEGGPLTTGQAFGRAVMRQVLGWVPCLGLINYLTAFGQQRTCIHDMIARTRVISWDA